MGFRVGRGGGGERESKGPEKANGRRDEIEARAWVALRLGLSAGVHRGSLGKLLPAEPPVMWTRRQTAWGGLSPPDEFPETLVLITLSPWAGKAVDGYVKPQIKQVVPE